MKFNYIANGRLYTYLDGKSGELTSRVLDSYLKKVRDAAGRNEWKYTGDGAAFRGAYQPGMDAQSRVSSVSSHIFCADIYNDEIVYSLVIDRSSGIYTRREDNDTDGIVISSGDTVYRDFDIDKDRMVLTTAFAGESHIGVLDIGNTSCRVYTEGHTWDSQPVWSASEMNKIYFCCAGLPLDEGDNEKSEPVMDYSQMVTRMFTDARASVRRGPTSICLLDIEQGDMDELLCDDRYDYTHPQSTRDGSLYYIRKPYKQEKNGGSGLGCLLDALLFPFRLVGALFGFLNVFSAKYSGKTLTNSAGTKQRDEQQMIIDGNLINAEKELRANKSRGEENPGIIPHTWELHRRSADGSDTLIKRGAAAFRVLKNGDILVSNGSAILRIGADGREEKLIDAHKVTFIK